MFVKTKEELLEYIKGLTDGFRGEEPERFTASAISARLNVSRNLTSQYLNELVKDGLLVKANLRPVYFFHKGMLEAQYDATVAQPAFDSLRELAAHLNREKNRLRNFQKAVGSTRSISDCIEQLKAAVKYPPHGLPVLLAGQPGTGKKLLARLMYEYAADEGVLPPGRLVAAGCAEYRSDGEALAQIFGDVRRGDAPGCLAAADGGMLLLDEAGALGSECQERLLQFMQTGRYSRCGEDAVRMADVRLVFTVSAEPGRALDRALQRLIPVSVSVPPLEERTPEEKKELLLYFFKREARKNGRKIFIGTSVFHRMMDYVYAGNVAQLKNCVRSCCANAFLYSDADAESLYVYQYHLPEEILAASRADPAAENEQESLISINEYEKLDAVDIFVRFYDSILGCFARQAGEEASLGGVFERCYAYINSFMDYLYFDKKHTNSRFNAIKQVVDGVLEAVSEKYHAVLPVHCGFLISRGLHAQMQRNLTLQRWLERRDAELEGALGTLRRTSPGEMTIALEASELIGQNMDLRISKMDLLLLALNIKYSNKGVQVSAIRGVIACRGYATASSMAETVNKLIGRHTFDAIDLPVNAGEADLAVRLGKYIRRRPTCRAFILLFDTGSMEAVGEGVGGIANIRLGLADNVSTALALAVGRGIWSGQEIGTILKSACGDAAPGCRVLASRRKQEAVVFMSDADTGVAERMIDLFSGSLPRPIETAVIAYDYYRLIQSREEDELFGRYDVKLLIGAMDPGFEGIPFLAIGDMITAEGLGRIDAALSGGLDAAELDAFNKNLLKDFSLLNVVKHLTILNPEKLMGYVQEAVTRLRGITGKRFSNRVTIALYIHISCLIERLITRTPIEQYPETEGFLREKERFVAQVKEAFHFLTSHYAVEIPVSEIAYIYQLVALDYED